MSSSLSCMLASRFSCTGISENPLDEKRFYPVTSSTYIASLLTTGQMAPAGTSRVETKSPLYETPKRGSTSYVGCGAPRPTRQAVTPGRRPIFWGPLSQLDNAATESHPHHEPPPQLTAPMWPIAARSRAIGRVAASTIHVRNATTQREVLSKAVLHADGDVAKRLEETNVWKPHRAKGKKTVTGEKTRVNITSEELCGVSPDAESPAAPAPSLC